MNYLINPILTRERTALKKALALLERLKPHLEEDERLAKAQLATIEMPRRVTFASAQRREEAKMVLATATRRVDKLCDSRNALRDLLESCHTPKAEEVA